MDHETESIRVMGKKYRSGLDQFSREIIAPARGKILNLNQFRVREQFKIGLSSIITKT
jgi:hypothetical protein